MSPWWWSWLLAAGGIFGLWLAGRKNMWGWAVGLLMQVLWIVYAVVTAQYGFIAAAVAYGFIYGVNFYRWRASQIPQDNPPYSQTSASG